MADNLSDKIRVAREQKGWTQQDVAGKLGMSRRQYSKYEGGQLPKYKTDVLDALKEILEIQEPFGEQNVPRGTPPPPLNKIGIPIYEGSIVKMDNNMELHEYELEGPDFFVQIPQYRDCDLGARASGDKMYPEIRNGDLLICKRVIDHDTVIFGDIYLLVLKGGMQTVNYIHPGLNDEFFLLKNRNESAPPTPMAKNKVAMIYKVRGVFKGY